VQPAADEKRFAGRPVEPIGSEEQKREDNQPGNASGLPIGGVYAWFRCGRLTAVVIGGLRVSMLKRHRMLLLVAGKIPERIRMSTYIDERRGCRDTFRDLAAIKNGFDPIDQVRRGLYICDVVPM
jgi:hypothetical protein